MSIELVTARGFCIAQKPFPVIVINTKDGPYGRVFTIFHELVHIGLGQSVVQNMGHTEDNPHEWSLIEQFCNAVAAVFLVPENELLHRVNLLSPTTDLPQLSRHFGVSPEVIMRHLQKLGHISLDEYRAYKDSQLEKYKDNPRQSGPGPSYDRKLLNASGEYFARTAFAAYHEGKITLADLASAFYRCDTKHLFAIESVIFP